MLSGKTGFLLGFAVYFAVLWIFWNTGAVYPIKVFVVLLHEMSHGLAAVATGGSIQEIALTPAQGGYCRCPGGNAFLTLSAGYLGSALWGALFLTVARRERWVNAATMVVGLLVLGTALLYVRSLFGFLFAVAFGGALLAFGRYLSVRPNKILMVGLGLTSCLYAVLDIKSDILDRPELQSDARMLAELTGVPTVFWGGLWILAALALAAALFRRALKSA